MSPSQGETQARTGVGDRGSDTDLQASKKDSGSAIFVSRGMTDVERNRDGKDKHHAGRRGETRKKKHIGKEMRRSVSGSFASVGEVLLTQMS